MEFRRVLFRSARLGLNILDARLHTTGDGFVLDSYVVMEGDNTPITQPIRFEEIRTAMRKVLSDPEVSTIDVNRRVSQRLRHFNTPTNVHFSPDEARGRTMLELVTADQPGLLSIIGRVFQKRGILLNADKIGTIGERGEEVVYVTDRMHQPITEIGRASGRERVGQYVSFTVVAVLLKKKKKHT